MDFLFGGDSLDERLLAFAKGQYFTSTTACDGSRDESRRAKRSTLKVISSAFDVTVREFMLLLAPTGLDECAQAELFVSSKRLLVSRTKCRALAWTSPDKSMLDIGMT
jgi:hypothetical protein